MRFLHVALPLLAVQILGLSSAQAGFVENANRIDNSGFPSFFTTRMDAWFAKNVPRRTALNTDEAAYVATFNSHLKSFGIRTSEGYIREVTYNPDGPFRFLDFEGRQDIHAATLNLLKKRAPHFVTKNLPMKIGVGIAPPNADIELILWQDDLSKSPFAKNKSGKGEVVLKLKNSEIIDITTIEIGPSLSAHCPSVTVSTQVDRVTNGVGEVKYVVHVDQFQDLALDQTLHKLYEKVWDGLNLNPGLVTCDLKSTSALDYP
jgi:hypothetical protein